MNRILIKFWILIFCINSFGQVSLNKTFSPHSDVLLDLRNLTNKGLLLPFSTVLDEPKGNLFFDDVNKMVGIVLDDSNNINYLSPWTYNGNDYVSLIDNKKVIIGTINPKTKLHLIGDPLNNAANGTGGGGDFILGDAGFQHLEIIFISSITKC
jgi:hypothetical protein